MTKVDARRAPSLPARVTPPSPGATKLEASPPKTTAPSSDLMAAPLGKRTVSITGRRPAVALPEGVNVDPALAAAAQAAVKGASDRFNGKYLVTGTTHRLEGPGTGGAFVRDGSSSTSGLPATPTAKAQGASPTAFASFVRNSSDAALPSATGAISRAEWNAPERLVARMTQNASGVDGAVSASSRCGPSNLLAVALLQGGKEGAATLLDKTLASAGGRLEASDRKELERIATAVRSGSATFDDLSKAQGLLYAADNTRAWLPDIVAQAKKAADSDGTLDARQLRELDRLAAKDPNLSKKDLKDLAKLLGTALDRELSLEKVELKGTDKTVHQVAAKLKDAFFPEDTGLDDSEIAAAAKRGGMTQSQRSIGAAGSMASKALEAVKPGQSAVLRVAANDSETTPGHFVTVGRLADGRPFIYNPDPAKGDATLITGSATNPQPAEFATELAKYDKRSVKEGAGLPPVTIVGKPKA